MQKIPEADKEKHARDFTETGQWKLVYDTFYEGIRFIVVSRHTHFTAYVGVPTGHPLAGKEYDDIPHFGEHGGLTFSDQGGNVRPEGWYWYGWDYAHSNDYVSDGYIDPDESGLHDWTLEEVVKDSQSPLYQFKKLARLVE